MKSRKGIALPIEMIVIIAIAVLVLVVLAALFLGGTRGLGGEVDRAFGILCADQAVQCGLSPSQITRSNQFDINGDGTVEPTTSLAEVCALKGLDEVQCKRRCGCTG